MKAGEFFAKLGLQADKKSFAAGDRLLAGIKTGLVALASFQTVKWFAGVVNGSVQAADRIDELAQIAGVSAEAIQQLGYAGKFSGLTSEDLAASMGKLAMNAKNAKEGSEGAAKAFAKAGVSTKDLLDGSLPLDAALGDIAETFKNMPDGPAKVALAMELFGKSGRNMIPMLNAGKDGIGELRKEFVALGGQISNKDVKAFATFADTIDKVKTAIKGGLDNAIASLLPYLQKLGNQLTAWFKNPANQMLLKERIATAVKMLIGVFKALVTVLNVVLKVADFLARNWEIVTVSVMGLVGALAILKFAAIKAALATAAAWAVAALPFLAIAAAIAAILLVVQDLMSEDSLIKEFFSGFWDDFIEGVKKVGQYLWDIITAPFVWIFEKLAAIPGAIASAVSAAKNVILGRDQDLNVMGVAERYSRQVDASKTQVANATNANANINITVPPGTDAQGVAAAVKQEMTSFWDGIIRQTEAALP